MRYMPTLRSPVSGSRVTTQGSVMNRPPSSGQHLRMGRLSRFGDWWGEAPDKPTFSPGRLAGTLAPPVISGAAGHGSLRDVVASYLWMTSLHEPLFTVLGLAWRKSSASESSLMASLKLVGGLA